MSCIFPSLAALNQGHARLRWHSTPPGCRPLAWLIDALTLHPIIIPCLRRPTLVRTVPQDLVLMNKPHLSMWPPHLCWPLVLRLLFSVRVRRSYHCNQQTHTNIDLIRLIRHRTSLISGIFVWTARERSVHVLTRTHSQTWLVPQQADLPVFACGWLLIPDWNLSTVQYAPNTAVHLLSRGIFPILYFFHV